jgi:GNAT superfamily N-acetyltransferase
MIPTVHDLRPADAVAVAELLGAAAPHQLITAEWISWRATGAPAAERFGVLVAAADGVLVGAALTGLLHESAEPGLSFANLSVHPDRRGRGAGSALLAAAESRLVGLGARISSAKVADDPACVAFAERRATGAAGGPPSSAWTWPRPPCPRHRPCPTGSGCTRRPS